ARGGLLRWPRAGGVIQRGALELRLAALNLSLLIGVRGRGARKLPVGEQRQQNAQQNQNEEPNDKPQPRPSALRARVRAGRGRPSARTARRVPLSLTL